jgi:hypothetical protein
MRKNEGNASRREMWGRTITISRGVVEVVPYMEAPRTKREPSKEARKRKKTKALKREETPSLNTKHRKAIAEAMMREDVGAMKLTTRELAQRVSRYGFAKYEDVAKYMEATKARIAFEEGRDYKEAPKRDWSRIERFRARERKEWEAEQAGIENIPKSSTR